MPWLRMMGEALSPFQRTRHRTKQSNAMQQFLPLVCSSRGRGQGRGHASGRLLEQDAPEPSGKKCRGNHMAMYASGYDPSTAALDSYHCSHGHVCRWWWPGDGLLSRRDLQPRAKARSRWVPSCSWGAKGILCRKIAVTVWR